MVESEKYLNSKKLFFNFLFSFSRVHILVAVIHMYVHEFIYRKHIQYLYGIKANFCCKDRVNSTRKVDFYKAGLFYYTLFLFKLYLDQCGKNDQKHSSACDRIESGWTTPDRSGKKVRGTCHQTGLLRRWGLLLTRPVC